LDRVWPAQVFDRRPSWGDGSDVAALAAACGGLSRVGGRGRREAATPELPVVRVVVPRLRGLARELLPDLHSDILAHRSFDGVDVIPSAVGSDFISFAVAGRAMRVLAICASSVSAQMAETPEAGARP